MGWTGPYPSLSRKRPTASLVSRKVLTSLLGQIALCIAIQAVGFVVVHHQSWYIPPHLQHKHSNIINSQNTTLFLLSCYQYILSAIVLSVGAPFRQSMRHNREFFISSFRTVEKPDSFCLVPFVVTIIIALAISTYLLFDPSSTVVGFMQLTYMSMKFRIFLVVIACGGFACAYGAERFLFPILAKWIGKIKLMINGGIKSKRKSY